MLYAIVHVVLPKDYPLKNLEGLDALRERIDAEARRHYSPLVIDVLFTGDKRWAKPSTGTAEVEAS